MIKSHKGFSFLMCFGGYGGFHFTFGSDALHLCLGCVAFTLFFYDVESAMSSILKNQKP